MKKLYILAIAMLSAAASQAQTIQLFDAAGNEINNGDIVYVRTPDEDNTDEDEDGAYWYWFEGGVSMLGSQSGNFIVNGEITDMQLKNITEDKISYQVCPIQNCFNFEDRKVKVTDTYDATDGKISLGIHISTGNTSVKDFSIFATTDFTVMYAGNAESAKTFTLVFDYDVNNPEGGVNNIVADNSNAPVEYFNLQGIRLSHPAAGQLVIKRQGNKATKLIIK